MPTPTVDRTSDITAAVHAYLTGANGSAFNGAPVEMVAAWEGDDNLLWRVQSRGQDAVVKLYLDAGQARSRRQYDGHTLMTPLGLAPAPLWVDRYPEGLARQVLVYRWAARAPLAGDDDAGLRALAEAVAQIHDAPTDAIRRFSPHPFNLDTFWRIEAAGLASILAWMPGDLAIHKGFQELVGAAAALVDAAQAHGLAMPPTAVHGDLRLAHAVQDRGQLSLVDWEMFGLGDPALDVARFLHREQVVLGQTVAERWLDAYLAASHQPERAAPVATYRALLPLADAAYLLNGLHTHSLNSPAPALVDALPDLAAALTAALKAATLTLTPSQTGGVDGDVTDLLARLFPGTSA